MKQYEITVKGRVQRVGYRELVQDIAFDLGFTGYVENMPNHTVRIVCVGPEERFEDFISRIRVDNGFIKVSDISVSMSDVVEEFDYFEIRRGDLNVEMGERFDTAIVLFKEMKGEMSTGFKELKGEIAGTRNELREEISGMRGEMSTGFKEVKEEISGMKEGISGVKEGISGMKEEISGMRGEMNQNFNSLDDKYHTVSGELKNISRILVKGLNIDEREIE